MTFLRLLPTPSIHKASRKHTFTHDFLAKRTASQTQIKAIPRQSETELCWARKEPNTFVNHSATRLSDNKLHRDFACGQNLTRFSLRQLSSATK